MISNENRTLKVRFHTAGDYDASAIRRMIDPEYAATYDNAKKLFDATKYLGAGENIGLLGAKRLATTTGDVITAARSTEKAVSKAAIISSSFGSGGSSGDEKEDKSAGKDLLKSFDDIATNPKNLWGKSSDEVAGILGEGWTKGSYGSKKTGWKFTKGDKSVFYHPGGGRHSGSYYGFSSGKLGKNKIVGSDYVPLPGDKATIINVGK